jgi:hypothetical protein
MKQELEHKRQRANEASKRYYQNHKETCQARNKQCYYNDPVKALAIKRNWIVNNYERHLWNGTRSNARIKGIEWDLPFEDVVIPDVCPYLGVPLTREQGKGTVWTNASIDRIDNSKGYIKGNIEVISRLANNMKQGATKEELIKFARSVLAKYEN